MRRLSRIFMLIVLAGTWGRGVLAEEAGIEFFEKKIRPVLVEHCSKCHASDAKKVGGGLLLDHRDGWKTGGDSGPAIDLAKPAESLLLKAIRYDDDSLKMPPQGKLPANVIADFEEWIKRGAPDPRDKPAQPDTVDSWEATMKARADWWSLKPVRKHIPPQPPDATWSDHPVDLFLLAKLKQQGLQPGGAADSRTLARRLSLVLTGLPPSAELLEKFVRETQGTAPNQQLQAEAVEHLVDSLLSSPHFGERWARHWLDVVHFTETHGNEWNYEVHHAWRYRDYLIRAFNSDVPYDQFVREHIAGDLLPQPRWNASERFNESIIATGFYRFGEVNHDDCIGLRQIGFDLADNQIDTLTKAFQASTVACARCHNHKLDAISMQDYYALLGVIRSSRLVSHGIDAPDLNTVPLASMTTLKSDLRSQIAAVWLQDVAQWARYLNAARARRAGAPDAAELGQGLDPARLEKWVAVLADDKLPLENFLSVWRTLCLTAGDEAKVPEEWKKIADQIAREDRERTAYNTTHFTTFADFSAEHVPNWQVAGQGLPSGKPGRSGDFTIPANGDSVIGHILPAGRFTHSLSDKLNGTLRSHVLPLGKAHISFQVVGQRSSAVRLVSNNCQLNYRNYRALTNPEMHWVTFSPPPDRDSLRTYAELMTMFDNPKFPDQLAALGGDGENYKLPWEKAAENPRSYFGITRVVLHDVGGTPMPEVRHLVRLIAEPVPATHGAVIARYTSALEAVIRAWSDDRATDDDARIIDQLLQRDLLSNKLAQMPQCTDLITQYRQLEQTLSVPRVIAGIADGGPGYEQPIFVRGDCERPGAAAPRRFLEVLSDPAERFTPNGSGRLELAERLASTANPLTARVMVNRIWHHLFGTGIVRTVDDFGHVGELPSHPELLDYLAAQFMEEGWSVKRLIRTLVLTRTFQLTNQPSSRSLEIDPQNRLLQHYPARRMEAEGVRDAILSASGRLDPRLYGMSIQPYREKEYADRRLFPGPLDGNGRRSIYIKNNLMEGPKFLAAFNFPGGKVTQGRRDVTNVPAQALALLNDPFVLEQAGVWAQKLVGRTQDSIATRIDDMFLTALNRPPTADEQQRFEGAVQQFANLHQVPPDNILTSQPVWKEMSHVLFNANEFIYIP